jgi:ribose transport system ATP-binding protein
VDVAAKNSIYQLLVDAASKGKAILVSSSDMKELVTLCDRVLVFRNGHIAVSLTGTALTYPNLVRESLSTQTLTAQAAGSKAQLGKTNG